jgi:GAF domain-containing protein
MDLPERLRDELEGKDFQGACESVVRRLRSTLPRYHWVGIYLLKGDELVLAAWDGPQATQHTRIPLGQGICGLAARERRTVVVDDVSKDPRYLACFPSTRSEIVVPIMSEDGRVLGEIDVDSDEPAAFGHEDEALLSEVARLLAGRLNTEG